MTEQQGSNREGEQVPPSIGHNPFSSTPVNSLYPYPVTMEALIAQVQWLQYKIAMLEQQLQQQGVFEQLRKVQFRVDKLYVKELSGTLNIGVSSINGSGHLGPLQQLDTMSMLDADDAEDAGDDLGMADEPSGDLW